MSITTKLGWETRDRLRGPHEIPGSGGGYYARQDDIPESVTLEFARSHGRMVFNYPSLPDEAWRDEVAPFSLSFGGWGLEYLRAGVSASGHRVRSIAFESVLEPCETAEAIGNLLTKGAGVRWDGPLPLALKVAARIWDREFLPMLGQLS